MSAGTRGAVTTRGRGGWWPLGLAAALAASAALNIGFAIVASRDASFAVEPDYYRKSLEWDRTMAQEAAGRALGWTVEVAGEPAARRGLLHVVAQLRDRGGEGIDGCVVELEARHRARAGEPVSGTLAVLSGGRYAAELPLGRPGLWDLRVTVRRGEILYVHEVTADLPGSP